MNKIRTILIVFSLLVTHPLLSQSVFVKNIGNSSIIFYNQDILQNQNMISLAPGQSVTLSVSNRGEIFENAIKDYTAIILFPNDSLELERIGNTYKFLVRNSRSRTNDFKFLTSITKDLGQLNNIGAYEEDLQLVDVKNNWKLRDNLYFKNFGTHLPKPPKSNLVRDSLLHSMYLKRMQYLNDYTRKNELTPGFVNFVKQYFFYRYVTASLNGIIRTEPKAPIPDYRKKQIPSVSPSITNDSLLNINSYRFFLIQQAKYYSASKFGENVSIQERMKVADSLYSGASQDYVSFVIFKNHLTKQKTVPEEAILEKFLEQCSNIEFKAEISEVISRFFSKSKAMADNFLINPLDQKDLLKDVLSRNEQIKIYYVDLWASWCIPCISEFPNSALLKENLNDSEIGFLYLSLDENKNAWRVKQKQFPKLLKLNNSYLLVGGFNSKISLELNIKTIPRYLIIHKNGEILDQNAPPPSDPKTKDLLILLKKGIKK